MLAAANTCFCIFLESSESSEDESPKADKRKQTRKQNRSPKEVFKTGRDQNTYAKSTQEYGEKKNKRQNDRGHSPSTDRKKKDYEWVKSRHEDNINQLRDRKKAFERPRSRDKEVKRKSRSRERTRRKSVDSKSRDSDNYRRNRDRRRS